MVALAAEVDERWGGRASSPDGEVWSGRASTADPTKSANVRTCELHEWRAGSNLSHKHHFDGGSIVTLDVLLTDESEFTGGQFQVLS